MQDKLKIIRTSWEEKAALWEEKATFHSQSTPLKGLSALPKMAGITPETAKFLKWKSLFYLIRHDKNKIFLRYFFKRPFTYAKSLIRSYLKEKSYKREGDFFFYGIENGEEFKKSVKKKEALVIVGFSYCHKPFECPSGRFSDACENNRENPICNQCFIGKCSHLLEGTKTTLLYIPTIHYIGEKIFEAVIENPDREVFFLITACEMSLTMFGDWGNMIGAKGIGIRLDGRICNTLRAFHLSEEGIKPGLTVVLDETKKKMIDLLEALENNSSST